MPYDPTKPANGSPIVAVELRNQFIALNEEIILRPTFANMTDNIALQSAALPDSVPALGLVISDPPTQAEVQAIVDAYNALLQVLKRE
jgi:hypothetical protein